MTVRRIKMSPRSLSWLAEHRGALTKIAAEVGVRPAYVSMILSGKRGGERGSGAKVVEALRAAGAPMNELPSEGVQQFL